MYDRDNILTDYMRAVNVKKLSESGYHIAVLVTFADV